uniref:Transposase n=1 Tax=Acrobeloides nanus TaxID=290746 RepID=A0A914DU51_9BILA
MVQACYLVEVRNMSRREVAKIFGVKPNTVCDAVNRYINRAVDDWMRRCCLQSDGLSDSVSSKSSGCGYDKATGCSGGTIPGIQR